jgi:hypothetical protein
MKVENSHITFLRLLRRESFSVALWFYLSGVVSTVIASWWLGKNLSVNKTALVQFFFNGSMRVGTRWAKAHINS